MLYMRTYLRMQVSLLIPAQTVTYYKRKRRREMPIITETYAVCLRCRVKKLIPSVDEYGRNPLPKGWPDLKDDLILCPACYKLYCVMYNKIAKLKKEFYGEVY